MPGDARRDPSGAGVEPHCGIDLVEVERVARLDRDLSPANRDRVFGTLSAAPSPIPARALAERFAAKEACLKLFPEEASAGDLGIEDIDLRADGPGGRLRVEPGGRLRRAMERRGLAEILLSTASSRSQAGAIAVANLVVRDDLGEAAARIRALRPPLLGRLVFHALPIRRRVILQNMRRVFASVLGEEEIRGLAACFYAHMARFVLEMMAHALRPLERSAEQVRVENMEIPLGAAQGRKGIILLTGHFGNWEVASAAGILRFPEYRGKFHFLRRPISTRWIEGLVIRKFRKAGLGVIPKKNSLPLILDLLERNEALVFIMDQHASVPKDGVAVEFFGEPAGTFRSLALIAKASGAPVIPAHGWREAPGRHVLRFEEPVPWIPRDDPAEEVRVNTRAYNLALERMILRNPEQWFWMHKRWKLHKSPANALLPGASGL